MVNYVCFNKGNGKRIDYHFWNSISENKYEMELVTTNEVGIKAGDKYVICESKSYFYNDSKEYEFTVHGTIENIKLIQKDDKLFKYMLILDVGDFNLTVLLTDIMYSLKSVYNYEKPYLHFNRYYRYLEEDDYNTIVSGNIFFARTVFGHIFNALPVYHKQQYLIELIENSGMNFFENRDYLGAIELLKNYVETVIEQAGIFLIASKRILNELFENKDEIAKIGFADKEGKRADLISVQSARFEKLFAVSRENNIWQTMSSKMKPEDKIQQLFNKRFANIDWPITRGMYGPIY